MKGDGKAVSDGGATLPDTRQVKVRLWGSGVGPGTARTSVATVPAAFMTVAPLPTLVYHALPVAKAKGGPSPGRKRKLSQQQQQQQQPPPPLPQTQQTQQPPKQQHKQKHQRQLPPPLPPAPPALMAAEYDLYHTVYNGNDGNGEPALDTWPAIDFDSETGTGTRPEYSLLRLRQAASHALLQPWAGGEGDTHSVSVPEGHLDVLPSATRHDAEEATAATDHAVSEGYAPPAAIPALKTAGQLYSFWKAIEDSNFFQPLSKVSQFMDDLHLRGGDYGT